MRHPVTLKVDMIPLESSGEKKYDNHDHKGITHRIMHCLGLLLALSLLYGCGAAGGGRASPSSLPSQPFQSLSVAVAPLAVEIRAGGVEQFSATVSGNVPVPIGAGFMPKSTGPSQIRRPAGPSPGPIYAGAATTGVIWSINGIPGGNAALGTISASGLYHSPLILPSPSTVEVNAASVAEPSVSQTALLTLYNPIPTVSSVTPSKVSVGAFTLTVSGQSFVEGAQVLFAGNPLPTTFTSSKQLVATGVATQPGNAQVMVSNPQPGSASSAAVLTVQVTAPQVVPAVIVVVTPAKVSTTAGATQQFTASVTGSSDRAVAWTVAGTGCSGMACETISSSGLYTAPAAVPSSATVTITATSESDPTKSASANVTIVPPQAAGYSLVWEDTFSSLNLCTSNILGCNWYDPGDFGYPLTGLITDPSGNYVNLNWTAGQGSGVTTMTTASMNGAYYRAWKAPVYIEVSMAFNPVTGNWPALWMQSVETAGIGNPFNGGEIDLFEWDSNTPTKGHGTVHVWVDSVDVGNNGSTADWLFPDGTNLANYNTYGFLWTSTTMNWYFNNQLMGSFDITSSPFNTVYAGQESFFLILNETEGCGGSHSCANQVSPLNMKVQWVHVYASPAAPG